MFNPGRVFSSSWDTVKGTQPGQKWDLAMLQAVPVGVQVPEHWEVKGR